MSCSYNACLKEKMDKEIKDKFTNYRKSLINTCSYGLVHLKTVGCLIKYFEDNPDDYAGLCTLFFRNTEDAHFENLLSNVFRIFDIQKDALSIKKFLRFIEANAKILFSNNYNAVRVRIGKDKLVLKANQNLLDKLKVIRDKAHFHQDSKHAGHYIQIYRQNQIPVKKLEDLIKLVLKMIDFYSILYDKRKVSFELENYIKNDIDDLFMFINRGKKAFENDARNKANKVI